MNPMAYSLLFESAQARGLTQRTEREEKAIRVRMLDSRHLDDGLRMLVAELGDRSKEIGRIYMARNPARKKADKNGKAYVIPPMVSGLSQELAYSIGDFSAATTVKVYAPARPMPTALVKVGHKDLRYRLVVNMGVRVLGWSTASKRPVVQMETPDLIEACYNSDDPNLPTVIRWIREWTGADGRPEEVMHVSDLTDLERPSYTVVNSKGADITALVLPADWAGWPYYWRYAPDADYPEGRPFHRFVISGDPRDVYSGTELVDATLRAISGRTQWWASIRDSCFCPSNVEGMELSGQSSNSNTGATGQSVGPETVIVWERVKPDVPGTHWQDGPRYDPELIGRALRQEENSVMSDLDIDVDFEKTGGEPTATQKAQQEEAILATFADCRDADSLTLRRLAAMANRVGDAMEKDGKKRPIPTQPENGYGILYRQEVTEELASRLAEKQAAEAAKQRKDANDRANAAGIEDQGTGRQGQGPGDIEEQAAEEEG